MTETDLQETETLLNQIVEEQLVNKKVIEFVHQGEKFNIEVSYKAKYEVEGIELAIRIYSNGSLYGLITGFFKLSENKKREYFAVYSNNRDVRFGKGTDDVVISSGHIPGLIRETIAQLLISNIIDTWHSSTGLTEGGKSMYEDLLNDPRLVGIKKPVTINVENDMTPQTKTEYILEKRI